jgi:hypothetical protein
MAAPSDSETGNYHHVFAFFKPEPVEAVSLSAGLESLELLAPSRLPFKKRRYCILSSCEMSSVNVQKVGRHFVELEQKLDASAPMDLEFPHWLILAGQRQFAYIIATRHVRICPTAI